MLEQGNDPQADLLALLQKQRQLLTRFLLITREQEEIIRAEDTTALLQNLEQRQQIIGLADESLAELAVLWQQHTASSNPKPALSGLQEEIGRILQEIVEIDRKNHIALTESMKSLLEQMRRASKTRQGAEAYIKGAEIFPAEFVDQRQ